MAGDILTGRLEQAVDRRTFLRGSGLFAAALGLGLASPLAALAEERQRKPKDEQKKDQKGDQKKDEQRKDEKEQKKNEKKRDNDPFADAEQPETFVDEDGREYRSCPQCGSNMYRQGRTWTCENCGYSYVE